MEKNYNPFEVLERKLDAVLESNEKVLQAVSVNGSATKRIPFKDFCKEHKISRVTGYAWDKRGLIKVEKIGGRNFVLSNSISVSATKYQRA